MIVYCWYIEMQLNFICWFLHPATLLNSLMSSNLTGFFFLVECLGFTGYRIMSSTNKNNFISPFQIWMLFISFSCLIGVVGLPILCGIEMTVMSILVLFPTSEERTLTFYFQVVVSFGLVLYGVYYVKITFLLNLLSKAEVLSHKLPIFFFLNQWFLICHFACLYLLIFLS